MAIQIKTKCKYLNPINYSKYINLQRTACVKQYDDNGKFLGDEFKIKIPEKNVDMKIFIPTNKTLFTIQIGNDIYGFKIDF